MAEGEWFSGITTPSSLLDWRVQAAVSGLALFVKVETLNVDPKLARQLSVHQGTVVLRLKIS